MNLKKDLTYFGASSFSESQFSPVKEKKAILVVSFGTSYTVTRDQTIGAIENDIQQAYPNYDIKRAFTSQIIIDKLKKRDGLKIDNVTEAMQNLVKEGYTTVICQPTHIMHGYEYDKMILDIKPFENKFKKVCYGEPLLNSDEDYINVVNAIKSKFPNLSDKEALILVGHGTEHFANATYSALDYRFKSMGEKQVYLGTVEQFPNMDTVKKEICSQNYKEIFLMPFMIVAGDHAINDICSSSDDSWKTELEKMGYIIHPIIKGLGELKEIRNIFISHISDQIKDSL